MKKIGVLLLLLGMLLSTSAFAVRLNPGGSGQVLVYPYFGVSGGTANLPGAAQHQ